MTIRTPQGTTVSSYYGDLAGGGTVTLDGGSPSSPSDEVVVSIKCAGQASLTVMVDGLMKDLASSDCANSEGRRQGRPNAKCRGSNFPSLPRLQ